MADSAWSAMTEARKGDRCLSSHDIAGEFGEEVPYGDLHKYLSKARLAFCNQNCV